MERDEGYCQYEPKAIRKNGEDICHHHAGEKQQGGLKQ
jgi:hypothetical protein